MNIKKESLLYVPAFCFIAGFVSNFLMTWEIRLFASDNLGNNSMYFYTTRFVYLYAINFVLALLVGFLIFRKIAKRELLFSALLTVAIHIIFLLVQVVTGDILNIVFYYISNWSVCFSEFTHQYLGNQLIGNVIQCFVPLILVLFGKKS